MIQKQKMIYLIISNQSTRNDGYIAPWPVAGTEILMFCLIKLLGRGRLTLFSNPGSVVTMNTSTAGTLLGWQEGIAAKAINNFLFMLAISSSFAGPMLAKTNSEGGGFHFQGDSSTGKSTLLDAGCSTWGGQNFKRSWRTTANGMEGAAALFNDCLLALDEISECDPREVGATRRELFGRGRHTCPYGNWGAAWLSTWSESTKVPSTGTWGEIIFTFMANGKQVQHAVWPKATNPCIKKISS